MTTNAIKGLIQSIFSFMSGKLSIAKKRVLIIQALTVCALVITFLFSCTEAVEAQVICGGQNGTTIFCSDDIRRIEYYQSADSFERFHGYGSKIFKILAPLWNVNRDDPKTRRCFIYGPYIPLSFAGRVTASANVYATLYEGDVSSSSQPVFTVDLTANRGAFVLDSRTVTISSFKKAGNTYWFGNKLGCTDGDPLIGSNCLFNDEPKETLIGSSTNSPLTDVEVRICNLHSKLSAYVESTKIVLDY